jgi:hypothetical protein
MNNAFYPPSVADSAVTKAYQLRARLSENERYLTEAYHFFRELATTGARPLWPYQALMDRGDWAMPRTTWPLCTAACTSWQKPNRCFAILRESGK